MHAIIDLASVCNSSGVLAAFDDAIADGVDILSVSLVGMHPSEHLYDDPVIAIGSFHAMAKGILTVQSAGNDGPDPSSVVSVAPWVLTVAASHTDRKIIDKFILGNGTTLEGNSINAFDNPNRTKYPIAKCVNRTNTDVCYCSKSEIQGKIVLCTDHTEYIAHELGAIDVVVLDPSYAPPDVSVFPSLTLSQEDYNVVESYSKSSENPEAAIMKSESIVDNTAPRVAKFSSRGPSITIPQILKPDITAPGFTILAAYSPMISPSGDDNVDQRRVKYNIMSGTSMSCPHVSGVAAYVKSFRPDWSPAAIKSATMTTAKPMNGSKDQQVGDDNEFAYGAGHLNPLQAVDPGLVYDLSKKDYIELLCNLGYNTSMIKLISGDRSITCSKSPSRFLIRNMNYPSIVAEVQSMKPFDVKIDRTVTNVGFVSSKYKATVQSAQGVNIIVEPKLLSFKALNEKHSFGVRIVGGKLSAGTVLSSSLVWSDGTHNVKSPIIVTVLKSTSG